jgi:hypothetical protein
LGRKDLLLSSGNVVRNEESEMSDTTGDIEKRVQRRAYELWEDAGRPEGRDGEFWRQAQVDLTPIGAQDTDPVIHDLPSRDGLNQPTV